MSNFPTNLVNLSQKDLTQNLQGKLSVGQKQQLKYQRLLALLNIFILVLLVSSVGLSIFSKMYVLILPLLFWLWLLRNSWTILKAIQQDIRSGDVRHWDGQIRYEMNFTPGLIRLANYHIQAGHHKFSVNQDILFQLQNLGLYRLFFTSRSEIFLGAIPITQDEIQTIQPDAELLVQFNERELEILALIADGLSNKEIAQNLHLSINTIKMYNSQIYQKLGAKRRTDAVKQAKKLGLIQ